MENDPEPGTREARALALSSLESTRVLLERHRYRIAGTSECRDAAHEIANRLRKDCDRVQEEAFTLHPKALWHLGRAIAVIYIVSTILVILGGYPLYAGSLFCLVGLAYGLSQYVFYGRLFDPLFRSAEGCNVIGTLEPVGIVTQQVILAGHHDSPYTFAFLERFQRMAFTRFLLGMISYVWLCVYSVLLSIHQLRSAEPQSAHGAPLWITAVGLLFAVQLFFMMSGTPSPGAGDNLNATSMGSEIAGYFRREKSGGTPLRHTRLIVLCTDGEEIGQRGAIEFARKHDGELRSTPTHVFNMDSIYHYKDLAVLTRDRNCTCALSGTMVFDILGVAAAGIEATTIIAQPTGLVSNDHLYHTSRDVVENIDVKAVTATLDLALGYIRKVDARA
jgi:aminopeptidase YwaD